MALNFPSKIYQILENESSDIVRWHPNGCAFRIVDHGRFEREIIPKYFRHNQLSSVQRQLNLYGFKCVSRGEDKGVFYHPKFKRGEWEVVKKISRYAYAAKKGSESSTPLADKLSREDSSDQVFPHSSLGLVLPGASSGLMLTSHFQRSQFSMESRPTSSGATSWLLPHYQPAPSALKVDFGLPVPTLLQAHSRSTDSAHSSSNVRFYDSHGASTMAASVSTAECGFQTSSHHHHGSDPYFDFDEELEFFSDICMPDANGHHTSAHHPPKESSQTQPQPHVSISVLQPDLPVALPLPSTETSGEIAVNTDLSLPTRDGQAYTLTAEAFAAAFAATYGR